MAATKHLLLLAVSVAAILICVQAARWPSLDTIHALWNPAPGPDPLLHELGLGQAGRVLCDRPKYRKNLLKVVRTQPYIGLFEKLRGMSKFEASGMTSARGWLWVVFDNLHALGRVDEHFQFRSTDNRLVGVMGEDSQFEGLTYVASTGHFIAVQEQVDSETHGLVPFTIEVEIEGDDEGYKVIRRCPVHFEFTAENKGFEGIHLQEFGNGTQLLVGLCEGNYCDGGARGRERGNGQMVISKPGPGRHEGDECGWDVVKVVDIPRRAYFMDYSGFAFKGNKVAVVTQEDSAMYVSYFNWDTLEFEPEKGEYVYYFPRAEGCEHVWCNVEGVEWLDNERLVIASDKAKSNQHYRCTDKDQSIAIVALPDSSA